MRSTRYYFRFGAELRVVKTKILSNPLVSPVVHNYCSPSSCNKIMDRIFMEYICLLAWYTIPELTNDFNKNLLNISVSVISTNITHSDNPLSINI